MKRFRRIGFQQGRKRPPFTLRELAKLHADEMKKIRQARKS